ncbi:MAG: hypothetical protein IJB70_00225 [Clostridia bacterium]|nr:hypothetical protein [Clostridia bacterium]
MKDKNKKFANIHEQIGSFEIKYNRDELFEVIPEKLPEKFLPVDSGTDSPLFEYISPVLSDDELESEIETQWKYYKPFCMDLAPDIRQTRTHKELKDFQWKIGTDEDKNHFENILSGEGNWDNVTVPHFGEPLGFATTYYRTEFELTKDELSKESQWICFKGVDYKAHVFINDVYIGSHEGFFAPFEFDFTLQAKEGTNILVVVVENDFTALGSKNEYRGTSYTGDKIYAETGPGYDEPLAGWHHCPPGMGIWQGVYVEGRSRFFVHDIFVRPTAADKAEVWLEITGTKVCLEELKISLSLYGQNFEETVFENLEHTPVDEFTNATPRPTLKFERGLNYHIIPITIPNARIWETNEPWLYQIQVTVSDNNSNILDCQKRQFGMRFFTMEEDGEVKGVFRLNGKKIKLRGANTHAWDQRKVLIGDYESLLRGYMLAKIGNVNYFRITQRPVQGEIYELCDRLGLLVQTDFPAFGVLRRNKATEAIKQAQEMEHLIRSHPSCVVVTYINEPWFPELVKRLRWLRREELELFFESASNMIHILNPDRVIKPVDGDYDPPAKTGLPDYHCYNCWYNGHGVDIGKMHKGYWMPTKKDWNFGCGEYGMEGLEPVSLMKKYYPKEWLPKNDSDEWHPELLPGDPPPQVGHLHHMFFDTPKTMSEWVEASQTHQAEAMNLMTRAYRRYKRMVSYAYFHFADAYPDGWMKAMIDFEGTPKKAFWEYRSASAPIMADLRYDRFKVFSGETINVEARVCNDIDEVLKDYEVCYQAFLDGELLSCGKTKLDINPCDVHFVGYIPVEIPKYTERKVLTVQLGVTDAQGCIVNTYEIKIDVFPAKEKTRLKDICFVGKCEALKKSVREEFDVILISLDEAKEDSVIFVTDLEEYEAHKDKIDFIVKSGAKIIFHILPEGETKIFDTDVLVRKCSVKKFNFVKFNPDTDITSDFIKGDVRYWYNESCDYMTPIIGETFEAEGYEDILYSAHRTGEKTRENPQGAWTKTLVLARKACENGMVYICQASFENRIASNPVARIIFERIINE